MPPKAGPVLICHPALAEAFTDQLALTAPHPRPARTRPAPPIRRPSSRAQTLRSGREDLNPTGGSAGVDGGGGTAWARAVRGWENGGSHGSLWTSWRAAPRPGVRARRTGGRAARVGRHPGCGDPLPRRRDGPAPARAGGHRHHPAGRGPRGGRQQPDRYRSGRRPAGVGDAPARAPQPELGHCRAAPGRPAPAGSPGPRRRDDRRAGPRRGPDPRPAAADRHRARRPPARRGATRRRDRPRGPRRGPGHHRVRRDRPGREAWPVRDPRRDPRRVPAHRGAPPAGGVLGRRRRGGPLLPRGRPALAGGRPARAVGTTVPRAAAHAQPSASVRLPWPSGTPS